MSLDPTSPRVDSAKPASDRGVIISVLRGGLSETLAPAAMVPMGADSAADRYLSAFELVDSASKALEFLEGRRGQLETTLQDVSQRAEAAVAAATTKAADWQRFATDLKARNADLEHQVATLERRADLAEQQRDVERERADLAERRSAEAQQLLRGLHAKVMSAFGEGTKAHDILSVIPDEEPRIMPRSRGAAQRTG